MSSSSSSDSDNDDIDLAINQIVMNNVRAAELIKELYDNNLLQDEVGETSKIPRGPRKDRGREEGHNKLVADYFAEHPVYNDVDFDRRFRMSRRLFLRIVNDLDREVDFFKQQWDARGVKGLSPLQKCVSAIRQLAYGSASDAFDEYLRMSETTSRDCLEHFCKGIIFLYMRQYLRKPTTTDVQAIYALHEQTHGLPGMLGSIDCMHWYWKNCPMAWRGQFHRGDHTGPSVILEAVASQDQWIWHAFFGVPGTTNDIIVVNQSPIFNDLFENKAPDSSFVMNNTHYNHGYYLADGIYPEWTTFVKAFRYPVEEPRVHFKTRQESARKDIERTFATLKDKWHVVKYPARVWTQRKLSLIMHTCIILHNMIREDEGFSYYPFDPTEVLPGEIETTISEEDRARNVNLVKNRKRHANLRHDLSIHGSGKADVAADVAAAVRVAAAPISNTSPTAFGIVVMMDNLLTVGPEPNSSHVGRAQGMYASADLNDLSFMMVQNYVFDEERYNGSTLSILGRNSVMSSMRELPVVGGSGVFRFARGYAEARTYSFNLTSQDAVVEYDVYVLH
ncbi:hypothetical protein OSB04_001565 [Centaurea solstitialis]|uniref:Dirigent protein n=1 Tax=Centaurea solstitialis TaxID=347529 RepID=A0AA38TT19_9ASTR|nr:hypothetical protein OSB04_001565 [Centaurea solstitialis]